jgi:hypothetical protein
MPRLSVWFVRLSLVHLWLGITFGGLLLANKGIPFAPWVWTLLPAHMEILLVGWLAQLAMGIAYWILPRFSSGQPRGDQRFSLAALILVNAGIVFSILPGAGWLLPGRGLETLGVILFALGNWKRVKPSGA